MRRLEKKPRWVFKLGSALLVLTFVHGVVLSAPSPNPPSAEGDELTWLGPDRLPLPFKSEQEALDFLSEARVVSSKRTGSGINNPRKFVLEKDGVKAHAVFRDVRVEKFKKTERGSRDLFRDDALFEVAAYKLSKLLGMDSIPPTVEREIYGKRGSLQLWVERAVTERKRQDKSLEPPDRRRWQLQLHHMRVFDNLIHNDDRNMGNMLFDGSWKLWLIDHTRAFRRTSALSEKDVVWFCHAEVWQRLQDLDEGTIREELAPYLYPKELEGLINRRELLVERIRELIAQRGERLVLFTLDEGNPAPASSQVALNQ